MQEPGLKLDASRLLDLHKNREDARALTRPASERYEAMRDKLLDLRGTLNRWEMLLKQSPYAANVAGKEEYETMLKEYEALRARMAATEVEISAAAEVANAAGRVFIAAMKYAVEAGLPIPMALADEAKATAPSFAMSGIGEDL